MKLVTKSGLLSITLIVAAILIFTISFVRESSAEVNEHLTSEPTPIPQRGKITNVPFHGDYALPHPGILPTNPLYPIKMIRDRFGLLATTNPTRRAELLLHYADKRIAAAESLTKRGENKAAISAAIKAEIYLGQAITSGAKTDPSHRAPFFDKLSKAALKHEEIIEKLIESSEGGNRNQATELHQQLNLYRNQIISLSGKPFGYPRPEDFNKQITLPSTPSASPTNEPYM